MEVPRFFVGKVGISAVNMEKTLDLIIKQVSSRNSAYICVANVRTSVLSQKNKEFCRIQNESLLTVPDGIPLIWYAKIGGVRGVGRVSGLNLMHQILSISDKYNFSHYFYGSTQTVLAQMKTRFLSRFKGIDIKGMVSPPFRPLTYEEKLATVKAINRAKPTFVWVALGAPKQEFWMKDMIDKIESSVLVGVGAAFLFAAGEVKRPPQFFRAMGMEWFSRCIQQPIIARRFILPFFYFNIMLISECFRRVRGKNIRMSSEYGGLKTGSKKQ